MNTVIAQRYVARKLAQKDPIFAEAKKKMKEDDYLQLVLAQKVAEVSGIVKECEKVILRRCKSERKRFHLFSKPTIRQYIADMAGVYTLEDLLDFFAQATGYPASRIRKETIGSTIINRPYLITLIEELEEVTGKSLLWPNCGAPLVYLGEDVTYEEIARYFVDKSDKITAKRRRYINLRDSQAILDNIHGEAIKIYRIMANIPENISDDLFLKMPVKKVVPREFAPGNWDLPIYWTEERLGITLLDVPASVTESTKVSEIIDKIVTERYKKLIKNYSAN